MAAAVAVRLATNLKRLRERRSVTQQRLADLSGVPRPTLAHLESGQGNPTLAVLLRVAEALAVSVEALVAEPPPRALVRRSGELPLRRQAGSVGRVVADVPPAGISVVRWELEPAARIRPRDAAAGGRRVLRCEAGEVEVTIADEAITLEAGDQLEVAAELSCWCRNPGRRPAALFSLVLPAPRAPR